MRRTIVGVTGAVITALAGAIPAHAQVSPVNVIVTEGIGKVCSAAVLTPPEKILYGNVDTDPSTSGKQAWCTYPSTEGYDAPVNPGQTSHPQWWEAGYQNGSRFQGLFLPGIGPGANGPYSLQINGTIAPPGNACVDSIEGPGCSTRLAGRLTPAPTNGFGAHAGSSHGEGTFSTSSASGAYTATGTLGWDNSAATILPLTGEVTGGTGEGSSLVGFSSSRGVTGDSSQGNAGVQLATIGFQVEGIIVVY